ncbi:hypothetical protein [Pyrococcus sp. ST04]|uniref:hypothetical protein n=1 Tax=Pyrococcus sp. ST04 TaxID=1183377 RepID=UPI0002605A6D|nr:hypothetical protein [Pyrococcus sp. ST04]AFK22046.1 hypothetical protein Py04_0444 [Pyrococcus sp. ST04]
MRKLLVLALAFMLVVVVSGCVGKTSPTGSPQQETYSEQIETSTPTPTSQEQPKEESLTLEEIFSLVHFEGIDNGIKGLKIWVEGATWVSDSNSFKAQFPPDNLFYSRGVLYVINNTPEYGGGYIESGKVGRVYYIALRVPFELKEASYSGLPMAIVALDERGTLHLVKYSSNYEYWPSEDNPQVQYLRDVEGDITWDLGANRLISGPDYSMEYAYYVAWNNKKLYTLTFTGESLNDLLEGIGEKPSPKEFHFSDIKDVVIGWNGIYVLSGEGLTVIKLGDEPEISENYRVTGYMMSVQLSRSDIVAVYDGSKLTLIWVRDGEVESSKEFSLPGYEKVFIHLPQRDDLETVEISGINGKLIDFYTISGNRIEKVFSGELPERPTWLVATKEEENGGIMVSFWGEDKAFYYLWIREGGEKVEEFTKTEAPSESTKTKTTTETPEENLFSYFEIKTVHLDNLEGVAIEVKDAPTFRNVKPWFVGKGGYEVSDLSEAYFAVGNKLYVFSGVGLKNKYVDGEDVTSSFSGEVYILPAGVKDLAYGSKIFFVSTDGKLYLAYDFESDEVNREDATLYIRKYTKWVSWSLNVEGVTAMSSGDYHNYVAWTGTKIYIFVYSNDDLFYADEEGLEAVKPKTFTLPENIEAVFVDRYGYGLIIRTENALYFLDTSGRYGYGKWHLYKLGEDLEGRISYNLETGIITLFHKGKFYWLEVYSVYDENDEMVPKLEVRGEVEFKDEVDAFSLMYNTYAYQLIVATPGELRIYNVTIDYEESSIVLDQSFSVPFTPDAVYGEDFCYCHVNNYENYFYLWAGKTYYSLIGPNNGRSE